MPTATKKPKTQPKLRETKRHREIFEQWYAADRSVRNISEGVGVPESTLFDWMGYFNWHDLADARDAEANKIADAKAIKDRVKRLEDQRKAGTLLRVRGMQAIGAENFSFDTSGDMIRAIKTGVDIERQADGLPNWIVDILNADESTLNKLESLVAVGDAESAVDDSDAQEAVGG